MLFWDRKEKKKKEQFWTPANIVSLIRLPFLFGVVSFILLSSTGSFFQQLSVPLLAFLFVLDQVDGYIARKTDSVTKIGAMIDIMVDRIVELILWIAFAFLTLGEGYPLVPLWVPFVFITRGIITDTIRSEAYRKDKTPYEMITSKLGRIIVSSHISRGIYAVLKALTFCYVLAIYAFGLFNGLKMIGYVLVYASTAYCLARGVPVIYAARDLFRG